MFFIGIFRPGFGSHTRYWQRINTSLVKGISPLQYRHNLSKEYDVRNASFSPAGSRKSGERTVEFGITQEAKSKHPPRRPKVLFILSFSSLTLFLHSLDSMVKNMVGSNRAKTLCDCCSCARVLEHKTRRSRGAV